MKNKKIARAITLALSCLLIVGAALGITAAAASTGASTVEIAYKNVSYAGAPRLVLYTGTDKPLSASQEVRVLFWDSEPEGGVYNEITADYVRESESTVLINGKQHSVFMADGVAPAELRKSVYFRPAIVEIKNGEEQIVALGDVTKYSIFDYAVDMLGTRVGAPDDQVAMYSQLLDFATAIQNVLFVKDGVVDEEALAAAGGWANAYYIAEVEEYVKKGSEYVPTGESYRIYSQTSDISLSAERFKTFGDEETKYVFAGFRNADGTTAVSGGIIEVADGKALVTVVPEASLETTVTVSTPGVKYFRETYSPNAGIVADFDSGEDRDSFETAAEYFKQYGITNYVYDSVDDVPTRDIYYYYLVVDGAEYEIKHFYNPDGKPSETYECYNAIINSAKAGGDMVVSGKLSAYLADPANAGAVLHFFNVNQATWTEDPSNPKISTSELEAAGVTIKRKAVEIYSNGYAFVTDKPGAAAGDAANKVLSMNKKIYDLSDPNKTIITEGKTSHKTEGYATNISQLNSSGDNNIGASFKVSNKSPKPYYTGGEYVTHVIETDFYVDSNIDGIVTQMFVYGSVTAWTMNIRNNIARGDLNFTIQTGPGKGNKGTTIFDASGAPISNVNLAGNDGSRTVGKVLNARRWYTLRVEYTAIEDNALIRIYVDGQLMSYIFDKAITDDDYIGSIDFMHLNASRDTTVYIDNTSITSYGDTEQKTVEFDDGRAPYWSQGKYYEDSSKFNKGDAVSGGSIIDELDAEGNKLDNTNLKLHKTGGGSALGKYAAANKGGSIYIFDTDIKLIGTDNTIDWNTKIQLYADMAGSDDNEFATLCIHYKEDATGKYWTFGNVSSAYKNADGQIFKGMVGKWYNLRIEYNPADGVAAIYINNELFTSQKLSNAGKYQDNSTFAGIGVNIRAKNATYTELHLDNTIATTLNTDNIANGDYYEESEHYDGYVSEQPGVKVETDEYGQHINVSEGVFTLDPAQQSGHAYVYETDIKWNGISFADPATESVNLMSLKFNFGDDTLLELVGSANQGDKYLYLKVDGVGVGKLTPGYWTNLRVVYKPTEPVVEEYEIDEGETAYRTVYDATVEIYVNGSLSYSGAVSENMLEVPNTSLDNIVLTVLAEGADVSLLLDNTYADVYYLDDIGGGENVDSSEDFENDEAMGSGAYLIGSTVISATDFQHAKLAEAQLKFGWNGVFAPASSTATIATIDFITADGKVLYTSAVTVDKMGGKAYIFGAEISLEEWYNVRVAAANGSYILTLGTADDLESYVTAKVTAPTDGFAGVRLGAAEDTELYVDTELALNDKAVTVNKSHTVPSVGTKGTTYLFKTDVMWYAILNEVDTTEPVAIKLEMLGGEGTAFFTVYGLISEDADGKLSVALSLTDEPDEDTELIVLDANKNYTLSFKAEAGVYTFTVSDGSGEATLTATDVAAPNSFSGVKVSSLNEGLAVKLNNFGAKAYDGLVYNKSVYMANGTSGATYGFSADITVGWNMPIEEAAAAGSIGFVNSRGERVGAIDVVVSDRDAETGKPTKVRYYLGEQLLFSGSIDTCYVIELSVTDGVLTFTATLKSDSEETSTTEAKLPTPDSLAYVYVSAEGYATVYTGEETVTIEDEYARAEGSLGGAVEVINPETIGSSHLIETNLRAFMNSALVGLVFKLELVTVDGESFLTVYGIAEAGSNLIKLSLTESAKDAFFSMPAGVWHGMSIAVKEGRYVVTVAGRERAFGDIDIPNTFVKAVITPEAGAIIDVDNCYLSTESDSFKGKGDNAGEAIKNYEKAELEYDPALGEIDPKDEFTDAYIDIKSSTVTMSKKTATAENVLTFLASGTNGMVFETDLCWMGTVNGTLGGTAVFYELSIVGSQTVDGEEVEVTLVTLYAVGVYNLDTVATNVQYLQLYTSLTEDAEPVAIIRQDLWYNLRLDYSVESGDTNIFVNNTQVATVDGAAVDGVTVTGGRVALGEETYDTEIKLQKTYIEAN